MIDAEDGNAEEKEHGEMRTKENGFRSDCFRSSCSVTFVLTRRDRAQFGADGHTRGNTAQRGAAVFARSAVRSAVDRYRDRRDMGNTDSSCEPQFA